MSGRWVLAAAVSTVTLIAGAWWIGTSPAAVTDNASRTRLFEEVAQHIRRDYVDSLPDSTIYRRAIDGALRDLHDPHSIFLDPRRQASFEEKTSGQYGGVGLQMDVSENGLTVIGTLPGTPAEVAGIQTGDLLVAIEGKTTKGLTTDEASKLLRGAPGTEVHILIARDGVAEHMPITLTRKMVEVNPVQHAMIVHDDVGFVNLTIFSNSAGPELEHAIDSLRKAGARSLILDLRGDPGGLLDEGVKVSDLFLDAGQPIVFTRGRSPTENLSLSDRAPQKWAGMPMIVLTDSNSASASEIVAGALQDHDRALIVGTATYGKGSAQRLFKFSRGALKLTTALWFTPSGRSINRRRVGADDDVSNALAKANKDTTTARPKFRTDAGRTVLGGGGIVPDVEVPQRVATAADKALQAALGKKVVLFRAALVDYALSLKSAHVIASRDFVVTDAMRNDLYKRLLARGVDLRRTLYDSAAPIISRVVAQQTSRYVFGPQAEYLRQLQQDPTATRAFSLLHGVHSQKDLFARAMPTSAR
ncbi:MAG: carboxyl-terminal protease [Gemmatimonadetes bacterium]|nr:carboxyl-terminal protease [Gemmatimonadota bacterium]